MPRWPPTWKTPITSRSPATNTLAVVAPDRSFAGIAELWDSEPHVHHFVSAVVHPQHQGRGIGAALVGWVEARGRQLLAAAPPDARVILRQFKMSDDISAATLLRGQGYVLSRHNLRMTIDFTQPPPQPIPPAGLLIRPFVRGPEDRALISAVREEFRDHWGYVETPYKQDYEEWQHWMDTGPTCDPSLFFVALDGDEVAGTALCQDRWAEDPESGWIFALGVRRPWRRRGVALALLQHCFWALHGRGKRRAKLGVDAESLTGATRLYEKAGMTLERQFDFYELELRAGKELSTQEIV
jgi:ribosomal protein S18 acetylase RimI-like enzyme